MNLKRSLLAVGVLLAAGLSNAAMAATTANFDVRITITAACDVSTVAADAVNFGAVPSTSTNVTANGNVTVNCTPGTSYALALSDGGYSTGALARRMQHATVPTEYVPYNLYQDVGRNTVWGSAVANRLNAVGTGAAKLHPVYGLVPSANHQAGNYLDNVTVTVTF